MGLSFVLQFLLWISSINGTTSYDVHDIEALRDANLAAVTAAYNDAPTVLMLQSQYDSLAHVIEVSRAEEWE